jgi:hypothetical protein
MVAISAAVAVVVRPQITEPLEVGQAEMAVTAP